MIRTTRRDFIQKTAATLAGSAALSTAMARRSQAIDIPGSSPFLNLHERFTSPVQIESVDQLKVGNTIYFRVRSTDGAEGICHGNERLKVTVEMAKKLVIPFFVGKDARDIESLVDRVYTDRDSRGSVYKYAGMPFWNIVGHIEVAIFDMLGCIADVPVSTLLGGARRNSLDVYISQFGRTTTAEEEVENAEMDLVKTGARATKLKVGLRMKNSPAQMKRDRRMIELARKRLGDDITIYVDANSSYTVEEAIEMGRHFEEHNVALFEEPLPWQNYRGTKKVTDALKMTVAGGEQDSSLWQWREMIENRIIDHVQPDVFYNGVFVRTLRVSRMAEKAGMQITPHSPTTLPRAAANLHLCAVVPNLGPFQEYRAYGSVVNGKVTIPTSAGLGVNLNINNATRL